MPAHMRTPAQVEALARQKYRGVWVAELRHPSSTGYAFVLGKPSALSSAQEPEVVDQWLREWAQWGRRHPEVTLRTKNVKVAGFGTQELFTHAVFPTAAALAGFDDDTRGHWRRARRRWDLIVDRFDPPPTQVDSKLATIVDLPDVDFELLLEAADWFRRFPHSGLTIRRIPVAQMHTKWLKRHRQLVIALLGHTPAGPANDQDDDDPDLSPSDLDALGLKPLPPEIDVLILDRELRQRLGGLRAIRAPLQEIAAVPIQPRLVLIVENKEAALPLRERPGTVVLHSLGNHLDALTQIPWLPPANTWYWGDLDRHGFTLLSRARTRHLGLKSLLMDPEALADYRHLDTGEKEQRWDEPDPTLTYVENEALCLIRRPKAPHVRIEQERLPTSAIEEAMDRVAGESNRGTQL